MATGTIKRPATPIVVDFGASGVVTIPANSMVTKSVTFSKNFSSAPSVMLTMESDSGAVSGGTMVAIALQTPPTRTGFVIKAFNSDTTQRQPNVRWLAVGS